MSAYLPSFGLKDCQQNDGFFGSSGQNPTQKERAINPTQLRIYYQNVNRIKSKLLQWRSSLELCDDVDIVAATETNFDESICDAEVCGSGNGGWSMLRRDRSGRGGGGVMLVARAVLQLERVQRYETPSGEDLWAKILLNGQTILVCVVYTPPGSSDDTYYTFFDRVINVSGLHSPAKILVLGDLNLHSASNTINEYFTYFKSVCDLEQYNNIPNKNDRMLDVVMTGSQLSETVRVRAATPAETFTKVDAHHPPLVTTIGYRFSCDATRVEPSNINTQNDWNFASGDYLKLYCMIRDFDWGNIWDYLDVNHALNFLYLSLYTMFDLCIPKKRRTKHDGRSYPVYYTKQIIHEIGIKAAFHRSWKLTNDQEAREKFRVLRSKIKSDIKVAYDNYNHKISTDLTKNPRQFFQFISSLRCRGGLEPKVTRGEQACSGAAAATAFADHFSSVFLPESPTLDPAVAATAPADQRHIDVGVIHCGDVQRAIGKLKATASAGPDAVPAFILKACASELIPPITFVFNLILKTGSYPTIWKRSRVTPIPKSGSKTQVENYRPVAILCALAKLFESVLHAHLLPQCQPYITSAQHAFLPKRSVATNLVTLVDKISFEMDNRKPVDVIYLDFQKAFDRVDNDVLLMKLGMMGFTPRLIKLFSNYLKDRKQYVKYGPYVSGDYNTRSGISQGSNLGPLLFVILINDLPNVVSDSSILIFADDVKLYRTCESELDCKILQRDLDAVHAWSIENKLYFNPSKCETMTFTRSSVPLSHTYSIGGVPVSRVRQVRDLGVLFDPALTFHAHVQHVADAARRRLGFVLRNAGPLSPAATQALYNALVRSLLETSSIVWGPHEDKYILLLERIQKQFLRALYKKLFTRYPFMYPTSFLMGQLGYQSLEVRRAVALAKFVVNLIRHKIDSMDLLEVFTRLSVPNIQFINSLRPRYRALLAQEQARTVARRQAPAARARTVIDAVLEAAPHCDLFATGMGCLMMECNRVCEAMYARASTIVN
ncbi:hypothetical protein O0L34_g18615 [Tuta absoluta]|nr:hypothetical protein O0L34_g18615 [Tuta absoluta]